MAGILVIVLGSGFIVLAIWWLIHLIFIFHRSQSEIVPFHSMLSTHQVMCKYISLEGALKFIFGIALLVCAFTLDDVSFFGNQQIATIAIFIAFLGLNDMLTILYSRKSFVEGIGMFLTSALFLICAIMLFGNSTALEYPLCNIHSLSCIPCLTVSVIVIIEFKISSQVMLGFIRVYSILVLGSWLLQANFLIEKPFFPLLPNDIALKISIYFTWHCALDFIITLCLWNIVYKLCDRGCCFCLATSRPKDPDTLYLENRVHFDMTILGRLEESENEEV